MNRILPDTTPTAITDSCGWLRATARVLRSAAGTLNARTVRDRDTLTAGKVFQVAA
jgi:hypothetical protein